MGLFDWVVVGLIGIVACLCWAVQSIYRKFIMVAQFERDRNEKDIEVMEEILKMLKEG